MNFNSIFLSLKHLSTSHRAIYVCILLYLYYKIKDELKDDKNS